MPQPSLARSQHLVNCSVDEVVLVVRPDGAFLLETPRRVGLRVAGIDIIPPIHHARGPFEVEEMVENPLETGMRRWGIGQAAIESGHLAGANPTGIHRGDWLQSVPKGESMMLGIVAETRIAVMHRFRWSVGKMPAPSMRLGAALGDRKSTRLNSSHVSESRM